MCVCVFFPLPPGVALVFPSFPSYKTSILPAGSRAIRSETSEPRPQKTSRIIQEKPVDFVGQTMGLNGDQ